MMECVVNLLIGSGADIKTVQHRLGHSSASLTMNIYAHAIAANDRIAADTIGSTQTEWENHVLAHGFEWSAVKAKPTVFCQL